MNLVDELHAIARTLREASIEYAVCGGIAVTIHGATRTTKVIELLVRAAEVQRILELVRQLGYRFAALPMTFDAGTSKERHVQRVSKLNGTGFVPRGFRSPKQRRARCWNAGHNRCRLQRRRRRDWRNFALS